MSEPSTNDQRQQPRFPCVGIELLYSPLEHGVINNVGQSLIKAKPHDISLAGIAFDVTIPLDVDCNLHVLVKTPSGDYETMVTKVCWCNALDRHYYRVGVSIIAISGKSEALYAPDQMVHIGHGVNVPAGVYFICPACGERSWFFLVGQQEGVPPPSVMPLYNCSHCHTTRSIPSLFSHTHDLTEKSTQQE